MRFALTCIEKICLTQKMTNTVFRTYNTSTDYYTDLWVLCFFMSAGTYVVKLYNFIFNYKEIRYQIEIVHFQLQENLSSDSVAAGLDKNQTQASLSSVHNSLFIHCLRVAMLRL